MKLHFAPLLLFASAPLRSPQPLRRPPQRRCRRAAVGTRRRLTSPSGRTSPAIAAGISQRRGAPAQVKAFNDYLVANQVGGILPDLAAAAHRDLVEGMRRSSRSKCRPRTNGRTWSKRCDTSAIM